MEAGWTDSRDIVVKETVRRYVEPMREAQVDTLVLGCTHFPVLAPVISEVLGEGVTLINMGQSTALAVKEILAENDALKGDDTVARKQFFVSDKTQTFKETAAVLLGESADKLFIEQVDINKV